MSGDEIQKLLGGYATGTLTPEEREALFEAALHDQKLFDSLAREEALRDVLEDPEARGQLLASLARPRASRWSHVLGWFEDPLRIGVLAAACLLAAGVYESRFVKRPVRRIEVAEIAPLPAAPAPVVVEAPKPRPVVRKARPRKQQEVAAVPREEVTQAKAEPAAAPAPVIVLERPLEPMRASGGVSGFRESAPAPQALQAQMQVQILADMARNTGSKARVNGKVLRKGDGGEFLEIDPGELHAGDTVKLRLVPNQDGYITVLQGQGVLMPEQRVQRLAAVDTPVITSLFPAHMELTVVSSRVPQQPPRAGLVRMAAEQKSEADAPVWMKINLEFK